MIKTVQPIHFEDYSGKDFERLVFAYHVRVDRWRTLEWYGQVGNDLGRDIWGIRIDEGSIEKTICIQCANRKTLSSAKAIIDIDKVVRGPGGIPNVFKLVCASSVSAKIRDRIRGHAQKRGIKDCVIWSGSEFEEHLRSRCESLLARFINGVSFPDSAEELKEFAANLHVPCNVPHPPTSQFIRPGSAWISLNASLAHAPHPLATRHAIVLYGLHGIGKTQAACAASWESRSKYSAVLWIRGDSIEVLRNSFTQLCDLEALDLPEQNEHEFDKKLSAARRWLKEHPGWLLVADNVDNEDVRNTLFELVPPSFAGTLLITSCLSDWPPTCTRIELGSWNGSLCFDFLVRRLGICLTDKYTAVQIAESLGGLPIALEQAAAYVQQTRTTLAEYSSRLVEDIGKELNRNAPGSTNYPASFGAVLKHAVQRLTPEALFLLKLASFLAPDRQFSQIYETISTNSAPNRVKEHGIQCPRINVDTNITELNRWSLVRQYGDEFEIHPLVQVAVRDFLAPADKEFCQAALGQLFFSPFGKIAAPYDSVCWNVWWAVFPHMNAFIRHVRRGGDPRALGYLLNQMGLFLASQGLDREAVALFSEAIDIAKSLAGPDQPDVAAVLNNIGESLTSIGRAAEAKPYLLAAISTLAKGAPALIPHAESSCWNNLGLCHAKLGEREAAEAAFRKALALDSMRGSDDDFALVHKNNLAMLLDDDSEKRDEAERLFRIVAAQLKDEVRLAAALINFGALLYRTGRAPEAVAVLERANDILPKYFPPDHSQVKLAARHLAVARKKATE